MTIAVTLVLVAVGAYGTHLAYTALAFGWTGASAGNRSKSTLRSQQRFTVRDWMTQSGLGDTSAHEFALASAATAIASGTVVWVIFGGVAAAALAALAGSAVPFTVFRARRLDRQEQAQAAWPQMIEEIRVLTGAAGWSIPHALFDVGARGPAALRPAFAEAHRTWLLSTDFELTIDLLERRLADPAADATCETLLVAHRLGGADLDRRLGELAEDRRLEHLGRLDARAKQAGVRFARRFVVIVPLGMALSGLSLGTGRAAYQSTSGQILVVVGLGLTAACWWWSGRLLRLPAEQRVFDR